MRGRTRRRTKGMEELLGRFLLARFQFRLQALDRLSFPEYKGSTLRGDFGYAFKIAVCALKNSSGSDDGPSNRMTCCKTSAIAVS